MRGKFVEPQEVAPQCEGGCDYSRTGKVLVRFGDKRLVWRKPGSVWSGIGMPRSYCPAELQVLGEDITRFGSDSVLFEGGRLSKRRISDAIKKIRSLMKLPKLSVDQIDPKKTYIVEEP